MAAAAILNAEELLQFFHYWTDLHQVWWESRKFISKRNRYGENAPAMKFKTVAAAVLNSDKMLLFIYH